MVARRTVRAFKPEQISDDELNAVVQAGTYAPSGGNQQAAVLVVVQDAATRATLTRMNQDVIGKADNDPYYGAPTIVIALADATKVTPVEDATLALGNMFNAAFSLGLGSCWVHRERQMFASDEGKALLKTWGLEGELRRRRLVRAGLPRLRLARGGSAQGRLRRHHKVGRPGAAGCVARPDGALAAGPSARGCADRERGPDRCRAASGLTPAPAAVALRRAAGRLADHAHRAALEHAHRERLGDGELKAPIGGGADEPETHVLAHDDVGELRADGDQHAGVV